MDRCGFFWRGGGGRGRHIISGLPFHRPAVRQDSGHGAKNKYGTKPLLLFGPIEFQWDSTTTSFAGIPEEFLDCPTVQPHQDP